MYFGNTSGNAEVLHPHRKNRIEVRRIKQLEEGALRIDSGDDCAARDFFAVAKHHTGYRAVLRANLLDSSVRAYLRTRSLRGFSERARKLSQTAPWKCRRTDGMGIGCRSQQEHRGGACRPGTKICAKNAPRGNRGTQKLSVKKLGDKIGHRHRSPAQQIENAGFSEPPNRQPGSKKVPKIFRRGMIDSRRRNGSDASENLGL